MRRLVTTVDRPPNVRDIGFAQSGRRFHDGIEDWLQIKFRAAYDLQNVGRGGLLLECLNCAMIRAILLDITLIDSLLVRPEVRLPHLPD